MFLLTWWIPPLQACRNSYLIFDCICFSAPLLGLGHCCVLETMIYRKIKNLLLSWGVSIVHCESLMTFKTSLWPSSSRLSCPFSVSGFHSKCLWTAPLKLEVASSAHTSESPMVDIPHQLFAKYCQKSHNKRENVVLFLCVWWWQIYKAQGTKWRVKSMKRCGVVRRNSGGPSGKVQHLFIHLSRP